MDIEAMYEEFRYLYPELTKAADARHVEIWGSVGHETAFVWFESLANTLNAQIGLTEQSSRFASVFDYFDRKYRGGNKEVKNCIDVSLVENLFWQVCPRNTGPVWTILPKQLQRLYINFHGHPPKID
ncbi:MULTISPECIES: hypothetical protein [Alphaproteobacteria]|uniref:DUF7674 family protein n=1 Tax=Alphaproteobacteria TaxID=28211 RepID=UPI003A915D0B